MNNKQGISPILAVILLLMFSIAVGIYLLDWFEASQSDFRTSAVSSPKSIELKGINNDLLTVINYNDINVDYLNIKVDNISCSVSGTISYESIQSIDLSSCFSQVSSGPSEIVLITEIGVFSDTLILD